MGKQSLKLNVLLLAAIALALIIRLYVINFGLPAINDPDELMFEMGALRMLRTMSLNPGWFGHPATTTMYVLALVNIAVVLVGKALGWFASIKAYGALVFGNPAWLILPGRVVMALFGTGTVWLTYRLASKMLGRRVGLIAALLLALSPVAILWSQVIRSDVMASLFMLLGLLVTLRYYRAPSGRDRALAAVWLGVAIATKWPFALGGLAMAVAMLSLMRQARLSAQQVVVGLTSFAILSLVALVITSPYLVLAHDVVLRNLSGEAQIHHLGATGGTPLENAWWYLEGPLLRGLGIVGLAASFVGLVLMARMREARVIVLPLVVAFAIVLCCQHLVWERWALPLLPLLAIAAALALERTGQALARWVPFSQERVVLALVALVVAPLAWADWDQAQERMNDTRQRAAAWAITHIPSGSSVMIEHFGFDIYARPWRILFPIGELGCVDVKALLKSKVDYATIERARAGRSNVDYGTMPTAKAKSCIANYAILTQYDRYGAERESFPNEFAAYKGLLVRGQVVAVFQSEPGRSGGPVVRIVKFPSYVGK